MAANCRARSGRSTFVVLVLALGGVACNVGTVTITEEVSTVTLGGDARETASLDPEAPELYNVDPGDTVVFFPDAEGRDLVQKSNTITLTYLKDREVDDESAAATAGRSAEPSGPPQLEIRKELWRDEFGGEVLTLNLSKLEGRTTVEARLVYMVRNIGHTPVEQFLIVDHLPRGVSVTPDAGLRSESERAKFGWEIDRSGRVLIRETARLRPEERRVYELGVTLTLPGATEE